MKLTPFHSDSIWETYSGLRPRSKTPYKQALLKAIDGCIDQGIHNPRILVLGAGPGTYDVDLIFQALDERQKTPADGAITVVDWNQHDSLRRSEVNFIKKDIEEFLASPSGEPFNVVVAFLVVHHLVNWRLAMANIAKVASGGFLVFDEYECMKAGWIDWIDGTTGFVGLDLQLPQTDAAGKWSAFFRDYYSQLDKNNGIFWEPEVRGTDYKRFHRALTYSGFSDQGHCKENVAGNLQQLSDSFKALDKLGSYQDPTRLFSQFTWGSEMGSESYLKQFIDAIPENKSYAFIKELFKSEDGKKNSSSEDSNQDITFTVRVNTYGIPKAESLPVVANRLAETYWFEGFHDALFHRLLLLHIEELSTDQLRSDEYEKLQRKKLVQYLIFSGGFTQALVFAAPVLMTIKKISGWETETSKDSILVINDASEKKGLLNGHMKRMASFAQHKSAGSVTESFLKLRLPISIVLRKNEKIESEVAGGKALAALHDLHTGKLVEVAIPEYLLGEDNCGCEKEGIKRPISSEWCFSRFRAGILAGHNDPQEDVCKHTNQDIEFEWEENGRGASDKACHDIEEWVNKILPFLAPLLKQHIRIVIIGLYHVRVDDEGYGGLGSVFLAENIVGKLTEFDIERFRFMQAETQKFSSIYMIESLRKVVSSEEVLSKQMEKYKRIQKPLDALRDLREQMANVSGAITAIEAVMNPFYLYAANSEFMLLKKALEPLFTANHNVCKWDAAQYETLRIVWDKHKNSIKDVLGQFDENVYGNYFSALDGISENCTEITDECRKAGYHATALNHARSPLCWVLTSLSNETTNAACEKREVVLDNEVPPLVFNLSLNLLLKNEVVIKSSIEGDLIKLHVVISDDGSKKLGTLCDHVKTKLANAEQGVDKNSLSSGQTSTALALIILASKECANIIKAGCKPIGDKFEAELSYSLGALK